MRTLSASAIRGSGRGAPIQRKLPAEGSKARLVYDIFFEHRGRFIPEDELEALLDLVETRASRSRGRSTKSIIAYLRDYYGCDIRGVGGRRGMVLVGEWVGRAYLDYTAPALPESLEEVV